LQEKHKNYSYQISPKGNSRRSKKKQQKTSQNKQKKTKFNQIFFTPKIKLPKMAITKPKRPPNHNGPQKWKLILIEDPNKAVPLWQTLRSWLKRQGSRETFDQNRKNTPEQQQGQKNKR